MKFFDFNLKILPIFVLCFICAGVLRAGEETVLVTVDGTEITQKEVKKELDKIRKTWESVGMPEEQIEQMSAMYEPQMIEGLVAGILIKNECDKRKISVGDEEIQAELKDVEASLPNGQTLKDIMEQYQMTEESLKERVGEQIKLKKLLDIEEPSDKEIAEFYKDAGQDQVHARHILIIVDEDDSPEVKAEKLEKVENIRKELIIETADFVELAKKNSDCPSGQEGGSLGFFTRERMVKPFSDAAFTLEIDEISEVVETRFGYHIIQTIEKKSAPSLDEMKNSIKRAIMERKLQAGAMELIDELRNNAEIVYTEKPKDIKDLIPRPLPAQSD